LNSQNNTQDNVIDAGKRFLSDDETELIRQVKQGSRHAYQVLYQQYCGRVYGICYRLLGDASTAEDTVQEVFIQVWKKIDSFREESKFSTWLYSVATNLAVTHYRKRNTWWNRFRSTEEVTVEETGVEDVHFEHGLEAKIQRLPEQARMVFVLFAIEGYRHEEIANQLGIAIGSSKAQYHRARGLLREWIENE
jgi:RNA polymerase sigma factor (sigma-70 family)